MEYCTLGQTGVKVSRLCFGTMSFGGVADEKTSAEMFRRCREMGINFFDCANVYNAGRSEEILGELIADCRDEIVLTSKVGFSAGDDVNARGLSRRHIVQAVEASLSDFEPTESISTSCTPSTAIPRSRRPCVRWMILFIGARFSTPV